MPFASSYYRVEFTDVKGNEAVDTRFTSFDQAFAVASVGKDKKGRQRPFIIKFLENPFPKDFGALALEESYSTYKSVYSAEDKKVLEEEISGFHDIVSGNGGIDRLRDKLLGAYFEWLKEEDVSMPYFIASSIWHSDNEEWTDYVV